MINRFFLIFPIKHICNFDNNFIIITCGLQKKADPQCTVLMHKRMPRQGKIPDLFSKLCVSTLEIRTSKIQPVIFIYALSPSTCCRFDKGSATDCSWPKNIELDRYFTEIRTKIYSNYQKYCVRNTITAHIRQKKMVVQ